MRKVNVITGKDETAEVSSVFVQYHSANKFSVYDCDTVKDTKIVILENAEILVNPENQDELIIRTDK